MTKKILLLCDNVLEQAETVRDHINAIVNYSENNVITANPIRKLCLSKDILKDIDVLIIHYSIVIVSDNYLHPKDRYLISSFKGPKILFIQDEYRWVNETVSCIKALGLTVVFTCVPESEISKVYSKEELPNTQFINTLTGYVPEQLLDKSTVGELLPYEQRKIDIGYRGRKLSACYGRLAREKYQIGEKFKQYLNKKNCLNLKADISSHENERIYGSKWIDFLKSLKATLGSESGASVFDFSGNIRKNVERHEALYPKTSFEELEQKYFMGLDEKIKVNQISPRMFEAIALKTLLVLYEGEYSGILKPWRHYVPIKKDWSNINEVFEFLKDYTKCQKIIDSAYSEIALSKEYSFKNFAKNLDIVIKNQNYGLKSHLFSSYLKDFIYIGIRFTNNSFRLITRKLKGIFRKSKSNIENLRVYAVKAYITIAKILKPYIPRPIRKILNIISKIIFEIVFIFIDLSYMLLESLYNTIRSISSRLTKFFDGFYRFNLYTLPEQEGYMLCMGNTCCEKEHRRAIQEKNRKIESNIKKIKYLLFYKSVRYCNNCRWFKEGYKI